MRNAFIAVAIAVAIGIVGVLMHAQPSRTLDAFAAAVDARDPALLAPYVDLDALRANLRARGSGPLAGALPPGGAAGPLGLMLQGMADAVVGALVQGVATPEGVLTLLSGIVAGADQGNKDMGADTTGPTPSRRLFSKARTKLDGLDTCVVTLPQGRGAPVMLILTRRGLDWVLTDVGVEPEKKGQKF